MMEKIPLDKNGPSESMESEELPGDADANNRLEVPRTKQEAEDLLAILKASSNSIRTRGNSTRYQRGRDVFYVESGPDDMISIRKEMPDGDSTSDFFFLPE